MTHPRRPNPALAAARAVAQRVVGERFPELKDVIPVVARRAAHIPAPADLLRLGIRTISAQPPKQYTFTFERLLKTPDGFLAPVVARVTVDAKRRVVKAVRSK